MIVTSLALAHQQIPLTPAMQTALEFLRQAQHQDLPDGRIEIDGSRVYALIQSYQSELPPTPLAFETHRRYIDVQCIMQGNEIIGWAPEYRLTTLKEYDPAKDAWFGTLSAGQSTPVWLAAGELAVLYPVDGHAPKLAAGEPAPVKKIVIKVTVDG